MTSLIEQAIVLQAFGLKLPSSTCYLDANGVVHAFQHRSDNTAVFTIGELATENICPACMSRLTFSGPRELSEIVAQGRVLQQRERALKAILADEVTTLEAWTYLSEHTRKFKILERDVWVDVRVRLNDLLDEASEHVFKALRFPDESILKELTRVRKALTKRKVATPYSADPVKMKLKFPGGTDKGSWETFAKHYVVWKVEPSWLRLDSLLHWVFRAGKVAPGYYCIPAVAADALFALMYSKYAYGLSKKSITQLADSFALVEERPSPGVLETIVVLHDANSEVYSSVESALKAALEL